ncbi:MAG: hypothetical protein EU539_04220 [Promethearchaeota archaeon]|nr:MAG: hypothetical protein EU539_04220 [Candidatus Lokiarchaeota archaeon]
MEVLDLNPVKDKKIVAYIFSKEDSKNFQDINIAELKKFLKEKDIKFITVDFDVDMKEFSKTSFAEALNNIKIPYYQVDIPEYAIAYIYQEIIEKEDLIIELTREYQSLEDRDSYKGQSLKNWIDMVNLEIEEKEIFLSLKLRPMWIVKKMLDLARGYKDKVVAFVHFVQKDICEDICVQVVDQLRDVNVNVVQYTKKHTIKNIVF